MLGIKVSVLCGIKSISKVMAAKKITRREVITSYTVDNNNRFNVSMDNEEFPTLSPGKKTGMNVDREIIKLFIPDRYSYVVKRSTRPNSNKLNFSKPERMFQETGPSRPVWEYAKYKKVEELEKLTNAILKFMKDFFTTNENQRGLEAINHFANRVNNIAINVDHEIISQSIDPSQNEDITI